jgi:anaerobic nitric oxide reductase flavorubredoxin
MESLALKIMHMGITNHYFGVFGSFTWAGAAVKKLVEVGESLSWEMVNQPVEEKQGLKPEKYQACLDLGKAMADRLKKDR